jgi:ribosomal protein S18 acetylase RimI-like enzyme
MTVTIGTASLADVPAISGLLILLFSQEQDFTPNLDKQTAGIEAIVSHPDQGHFLVARNDDGDITACVSLLYLISTAEGGKVALLEDMIVHPDHRRQGIGKTLLEAAKSFAKQQGCTRVTLLTDQNNTSAQALYQHLGFEHSAMTVMRHALKG